MSKAVLISIKPKWVDLIASGRKKLEIRKTQPNLKTPFKCYIYCTKLKYGEVLRYPEWKTGQVVGEFECDSILRHCEMANLDLAEQYGCVKEKELIEYSNGKEIYGWHISNLKMYDKPKQIQDFYRIGVESCRKCDICWYHDYSMDEEPCVSCHLDRDYLWRAPQSWGYVEENNG